MASGCMPSALLMGKMSKNSLTWLMTKNPPNLWLGLKKFHGLKLSCGVSKSNGPMRTGRMAVSCGAKHEMGPQDENKALEIVLQLYRAIKNRNSRELSDIIAEECSCVSNFVSAFRPFLGKKKVLAFFAWLMKSLGNNIEFVVQQTIDDGMVVSVSWKLEWKNVPWPLGKDFSLHMCHVYQGKVMIKNVEMFLEPILHMEPLRLKVLSMVMKAIEKLNPKSLFKNKTRRTIAFFLLLLLAVAVLFLLHS
ncbi:nuclear transport factor 2 family protein [Striga asiatica]|uniref:Nuclear transport factor 2 family protein n=1 Tax=Striga asiatica TaxID=4170 RepID=A0A5A7QIZ9_STRAF|nr:nuclear transport factor 2 family protein [Striga asiatica]